MALRPASGEGADRADGEGHLRGGAAAIEEIDIDTQIGGDFGAELGKFLRVVTGVVGEDDGGAAFKARFGTPIEDVRDQAPGGTANVEVIHGIGANAGVVWTLIRWGGAAFGLGHHSANGPSAQATGAKLELLKEAVVQLLEMAALGQFLNAGTIKGIGAGGQESGDVLVGGGEKRSGGDSVLKGGFEGHRCALVA